MEHTLSSSRSQSHIPNLKGTFPFFPQKGANRACLPTQLHSGPKGEHPRMVRVHGCSSFLAQVWDEKVLDIFEHEDEEVSVGGACETCPVTLPENLDP